MHHPAQSLQKTQWFGPVVVSAPDPKGPRASGLTGDSAYATFTHQKTKQVQIRPGYWENGSWFAILTGTLPGLYSATFTVKTNAPTARIIKMKNVALTQAIRHGFLRCSPMHKQRFAYDDGTSYTPIGCNLAWQNPTESPYTDTLKRFHDNGMNWTRIWANHWDGKNPWWPEPKSLQHDRKTLWQPALHRWQHILDAAETSNVAVQMVLFHHGQLATEVNPNWDDHPWNSKNGGWLTSPVAFFTDAEAKRRAKVWIREAVARYAHHTCLMAWELFNEVEWVDAVRKADRWQDVEAWHAEMAAYIRSIDAYKHLITTSSAVGRDRLWTAMDYVQAHAYPQNIEATIHTTQFLDGKPGMFGEFGPSDTQGTDSVDAARKGIYAGILANHAGAGQYWYWDELHKKGFYHVFKTARDIVNRSQWWNHPRAKASFPIVHAQSTPFTDGDVTPAKGWGESSLTTFTLPDALRDGSLAQCSSYLQGTRNRKLQKEPITYTFVSTIAGTLKVHLDQVSKAGAQVTIQVDGKNVVERTWDPTDQDRKVKDVVEVSISSGRHTLVLENTGTDWVHIKQVVLPAVSPALQGIALVERQWALLKLQGDTNASIDLGISIDDGMYKVTAWNLTNQLVQTRLLSVVNGRVNGFTLPYPNTLTLFER